MTIVLLAVNSISHLYDAQQWLQQWLRKDRLLLHLVILTAVVSLAVNKHIYDKIDSCHAAHCSLSQYMYITSLANFCIDTKTKV